MFDVKFSSNRVYALGAGGGLHIFDATDPVNLRKLGYVRTEPVAGQAVQVVGSVAYVASTTAGLQIIDVSDARHPAVKTNFQFSATALKVVGNFAYVGTTNGLTILNVVDPTKPSLVGTYTEAGGNSVTAIDVSGATAYLGFPGLQLIDISNPAKPVLSVAYPNIPSYGIQVTTNRVYVAELTKIGILERDGVGNLVETASIAGSYPSLQNVKVVGNFLYAGARDPSLLVADVSNPRAPKIVGAGATSIGPATSIYAVEAVGNFIYAATDPGLQVLDNHPDEWGLSIFPPLPQAQYVKVANQRAYVAELSGTLAILDLTAPGGPVRLGVYPAGRQVEALEIQGTLAFLGVQGSSLPPYISPSLQIVDTSVPANPKTVGTYAPAGDILHIESVGSLLYLADSDLEILDISNPTLPVLLSKYVPPGVNVGIQDARVNGNIAYLAAGTGGIFVVDVTNRKLPVLLGSSAGGLNAVGLFVDGSRLYVADPNTGLQILNITDPSHPTLLGSTAGSSAFKAVSVQVAGTTAYVTTSYNQLRAIDVTDPRAPKFLRDYPVLTSNLQYSIGDVVGTNAYLPANAGLAVVDLSKPSGPGPLSAFMDDLPNQALIRGAYAYVADRAEGLKIVDVSDPVRPFEKARVALPSSANALDLSGDYVYVGTPGALNIVNVSDPANPVFLGSYEGASAASQLQVVGNLLYALRAQSVFVFDISNNTNQVPLSSISDLAAATFYADATRVFIAHSAGGAELFDMSKPQTPVSLSFVGTSKNPTGVSLAGNLAFVLEASPPVFSIFDVTSPRQPVRKSTDALPKNSVPVGLTVNGSRAYISDATGTLMAFDISNPGNPVVLRTYPITASNVSVSDNAVYLLATPGLVIMGQAAPLKLKILNQPIGSQTISLSGGSNSPVVLEFSANLKTWLPVWTNDLSHEFIEGRSSPARFYRARQ